MVSPLRVGLVALALAACLTGTVFMAQGSGSVYRGDPQSFRLVAEAPFGKGTQIESDPDVATHGVAYRYGRILFPVLAWMLALGRSGLVPWSLPVVGALSFAACAAVAATLCRDVSQPCERGLVVAGVPTLLAATVLVYAEPLAMALMLGVFLTYLRERKGWSAVLAAGLVLSREVLVLALLPIAWSEWRSGHRSRLLLGAATALGPFAVWASWVRIRVGEWPFLDPSESRRAAVGLPPGGSPSGHPGGERRGIRRGRRRAARVCRGRDCRGRARGLSTHTRRPPSCGVGAAALGVGDAAGCTALPFPRRWPTRASPSTRPPGAALGAKSCRSSASWRSVQSRSP